MIQIHPSRLRPYHTRFGAFGAVTVLLALLLGALATSCQKKPAGSAGAGGSGAKQLDVVCTVGMITDVARIIGADRAQVFGLMGEGVDPHLYKASPGDIRRLTQANIVLYGGLHLEGRLGDVLAKLGDGKVVRAVSETIDPKLLRTPPEFEGQHDPHVWFDVSLWMKAVEAVRDAYIAADESGREGYESRAAAYLKELAELHTWCETEIARVPEKSRVLITAHDAFGYFGHAYGIEVRAIQGISTDSEAGVSGINNLVDLIVSREIPAVFVESSVPRKTIDALVEGCTARGHKVKVGGELFSDAMGKDGTAEGTYVGMVRHNVRTIVDALLSGEK